MLLRQLFSRRSASNKVDFRPDTDPKSPFAQLRRLDVYMGEQRVIPADDITDCPDALEAFREYTYRKIFTNTTHDEYLALPADTVDWLIAVHETSTAHFQARRNQKKEN